MPPRPFTSPRCHNCRRRKKKVCLCRTRWYPLVSVVLKNRLLTVISVTISAHLALDALPQAQNAKAMSES